MTTVAVKGGGSGRAPKQGDEVTVVLKWPSSVKRGESRLVHTFVSSVAIWKVPNITFQANNDDRPEHTVADHAVTWLFSHVDFESQGALDLLRAAEQADESRRDEDGEL